ncbi:MAG: hypothetical protein IKV85_02180 [Ruminococcus sp.]|nr:hypothetical protein [Ruminococcus sp.]
MKKTLPEEKCLCVNATCSDCKHCKEGYCEIKGGKVNTNSKACPEFEEI